MNNYIFLVMKYVHIVDDANVCVVSYYCLLYYSSTLTTSKT